MNNPPQDLEGQFLFVQKTTFIPPLWVQHKRLGWILASHPDLPISELCLPNDQCVGWIVGHPVTAEALSPLRITIAAEAEDNLQEIEVCLATFGGRFVAFVVTEQGTRVYLDASGSMSVVYSSLESMVASTPTLIDTDNHPLGTSCLGEHQHGDWWRILTERQRRVD